MNNPQTSPQAAQSGPQTPPPVDNRPTPCGPLIPAVTSECVEVNRDVYEAQTKLLELVDDFTSWGVNCGPIEVINDLLYRWLTTTPVDLSYERNQGKLRMALSLVDFLTDLKNLTKETTWTIEEAEKQQREGGRGHE